ncbi:MAG: D-alanyl-D-alanine carboxypeptidase [Oscillospiraceae bacterium]|nr:D-alanyl-D-alanine carboxypeptidase [Oscillospiraceae bacterium]
MSRKIISVLCAAFCVAAALPFNAAAASNAPGVSAKAAIVIEAETGKTLYEWNADEPRKIASTTKILTALVALSKLDANKSVEIKPEWTGIEGSSMYLKAGEKLTVRDLLYGLLLESGNDAAVALACLTAGSVADFAELMNEKAEKLGCTDAYFVNPNGLDAKNHLASARDLAKITAAAMENEEFAAIVSTKYATVAGRSLKNHNKLLWNYDGCLGVKTGYTKSAGRSLVSCAERGGVRLICVTLSDPNDWDDHARLYDWAFANFTRKTIAKGTRLTARVPVLSGVKATASLRTGGDVSFLMSGDASYELIPEVPQFIYAVVVRGAYAGTARVEVNGEYVARVPVFYAETVRRDETEPLTGWEQFKRAWYRANELGYYRIGYYW